MLLALAFIREHPCKHKSLSFLPWSWQLEVEEMYYAQPDTQLADIHQCVFDAIAKKSRTLGVTHCPAFARRLHARPDKGLCKRNAHTGTNTCGNTHRQMLGWQDDGNFDTKHLKSINNSIVHLLRTSAAGHSVCHGDHRQCRLPPTRPSATVQTRV